MSCLSAEKGFGGEDNAQQAQQRCRGVGVDMRKVGLKFGGRECAVSQARTTKVVVTQRRETQKRKKTTKKEKNDRY